MIERAHDLLPSPHFVFVRPWSSSIVTPSFLPYHSRTRSTHSQSQLPFCFGFAALRSWCPSLARSSTSLGAVKVGSGRPRSARQTVRRAAERAGGRASVGLIKVRPPHAWLASCLNPLHRSSSLSYGRTRTRTRQIKWGGELGRSHIIKNVQFYGERKNEPAIKAQLSGRLIYIGLLSLQLCR